jgi:hypothetical protein
MHNLASCYTKSYPSSVPKENDPFSFMLVLASCTRLDLLRYESPNKDFGGRQVFSIAPPHKIS